MLANLAQELMTPEEAAEWFRRSPSWLRQQADLVRVAGSGGQPLYHVCVCRAYILGKMQNLAGAALREVQLAALAAACGLPACPAPNCGLPASSTSTVTSSAG